MDAGGREEMVAGLYGLEVRAVILWPGRCGGAAAMASERFPQAGSPSSHLLFRMRASVRKEERGTWRRLSQDYSLLNQTYRTLWPEPGAGLLGCQEPIFTELSLCLVFA